MSCVIHTLLQTLQLISTAAVYPLAGGQPTALHVAVGVYNTILQ